MGDRPRGHIAPIADEGVAVAFLAISNLLINRPLPRSLEIAASLSAAAGMLLWAYRAGAGARSQGLTSTSAAEGLRVGLLAGVPIGSAVALGAFLPPTRRFYHDPRIVAVDAPEAAYQLMARIPLATAAAEELIFRAGLEGLLSQRRPRREAALIGAALFGAWHVLPTIGRMRTNPGVADIHERSLARQAGIVAAVFAVTGAASLGLSWLRNRTGSILAPIGMHAAINSGGFLGGWLAARLQPSHSASAAASTEPASTA